MNRTRRSETNSAGNWAERYSLGLLLTDAIVVFWAVFGSQLAWFGFAENRVDVGGRLQDLVFGYSSVSVGLTVAWVVFLTASGSRDVRIIGVGNVEYRRVLNSSLLLFGLVAIIAYLLKIELARGYFVTALPVGVAALSVSRWLWRQYLISRRRAGALSARVALVGTADSADQTALDLIHQPEAGYHVVGAFTPSESTVDFLPLSGTPVFGTIADVSSQLARIGADTVIVTNSDELPPERMRLLSWSLEPGKQHLIVHAGLIDIAGPRMHIRPVAGLPLVHIETPRYEGNKSAVKRIFDICASLGLIVVLSLPLVAIALGVRLTSRGPVFFRQERVGLNGTKFEMLKFRSMVSNAEDLLREFDDEARGQGNTVMFKMAADPRVTRFGRHLRRLSLDELPQLFNVLRGEMSLVGPRPPLAEEVEKYEAHVNRRFLVKPGITGLWQVSGRSNLDWTSTVRLDLYYVENWSLTGDFQILWRTVRAVASRDGAF